MIFRDQLGRDVVIATPPKRIISLVPSQTELLFSLGLDTEVVGITRFCIHPKEWQTTKTRVGGTKKVSLEKAMELCPDLIIANKEENTKSDIEALEKIAPVWISDVNTLEDAKEMITQIGVITAKQEASLQLLLGISNAFAALRKAGRSVLYFIWKDPNYVAGKNTFIDAMLSEAGYDNACTKERYPSLDELGELQPEMIFLSTEPFPFKDGHVEEFKQRFPHSNVMLVDGEMFSWYGSRLQKAPGYFNALVDELAG